MTSCHTVALASKASFGLTRQVTAVGHQARGGKARKGGSGSVGGAKKARLRGGVPVVAGMAVARTDPAVGGVGGYFSAGGRDGGTGIAALAADTVDVR